MSTHPPDQPTGDAGDNFQPPRDEPDEITAHAPSDATGLGDDGDLNEDGYGTVETTVPRPVNWRTLSAEDAEYEWLALNEWVDWLRHTFGLPASIVPPYWHHHPELVWELSALHLHWLGAYDPAQHASAPIGWLADFHAAQQRLREWVALSGTRLDRDRPIRQTTWPGEDPQPSSSESPITDRDEDFAAFVIADVTRRAEAEAEFLRRGEA